MRETRAPCIINTWPMENNRGKTTKFPGKFNRLVHFVDDCIRILCLHSLKMIKLSLYQIPLESQPQFLGRIHCTVLQLVLQPLP